MEPIKFTESNRELQKPAGMTDEECSSLPTFTDGKQSISCWRPSFKEWLSILFHGRVWLSVYSGVTQPPVRLSGEKTVFEKPQKESGSEK